MRAAALSIALGGLLVLAGCDLVQEPFRQQLVVRAVLITGEPFPPIGLSRTFPITEPIPPDGGAVSGAHVRVTRLGADGEPDQVIVFVESEPGTGEYVPLDPYAVVEPLRRYRLTVTLPADVGLVPPGAEVRGETLTPGAFAVIAPPPDTARFNPLAPPLELRATMSAHPARQAIYVFSVVALEPAGHRLTPLYSDLFGQGDWARLVENSSPLLNEANYEVHPDGTITLPLPWFAIAFFGPNRFIAQAVDDALYDFIRSRDAQFSPTTLSPGEIPEALTNLSHAVGVFGSVARASVEVYIVE